MTKLTTKVGKIKFSINSSLIRCYCCCADYDNRKNLWRIDINYLPLNYYAGHLQNSKNYAGHLRSAEENFPTTFHFVVNLYSDYRYTLLLCDTCCQEYFGND